jgi:hypothetical protein|tara:strand:+ start:442 stop:687 length:246 start_codon:yes stop_codon:yes gene_type:complete
VRVVKGTPIAEVMDQYAKQNNITKSRMSYEQRQEGGVDDNDCAASHRPRLAGAGQRPWVLSLGFFHASSAGSCSCYDSLGA